MSSICLHIGLSACITWRFDSHICQHVVAFMNILSSLDSGIQIRICVKFIRAKFLRCYQKDYIDQDGDFQESWKELRTTWGNY